MTALLDQVRRYRSAEGWRILAEFADLLALDNQTHDLPSLRRNATAIAAMFTARGARMDVIEADGAAPLVVGRLDAAQPMPGVRRPDAAQPMPGVRRPDAAQPMPGVRRPDAAQPMPGVRRPDAAQPMPGVRRPDAAQPMPGVRRPDAAQPMPGVRRPSEGEAAASTIGVYVHYDGQPAGPDGWLTPPFEPVLRTADGTRIALPGAGEPVDDDWRLYARGSADDKAPLLALLGAIDALAAAGRGRDTNLVFCFEGEEESGSPHLRAYLERLRDRLQADAWLICDGPVHHTGAPQVVLGVRGYCGFDLTVYGPDHELHSGHYGNWAPNPALELARLLASCKDGAGTVTIDGFYDSAHPPTAAEEEVLAALPAIEAGLLDHFGLAGAEVPGSRLVDRLMLPSFNVRGLASGDTNRNVIPTRATASVDIRLAAGDDPARMIRLVRDHIARQGFLVLDREPTAGERRRHGRIARFDAEIGYPAMRTPAGLPIVAHLADAAGRAAGRAAVTMPTLGGSVPLHHIAEVLGAPTVVLPIANHDNNQHAANENLRIGNLWYGLDLFSLLLTAG